MTPTPTKKTRLLRNTALNWIVTNRCHQFMRKSFKNRSFSFVNLYLLPAGQIYVSLNHPFKKTTKLILSAFKEMVLCDSKNGRIYTLLNTSISKAREDLSKVVSLASLLSEKIPKNHLNESSMNDLFQLLSGSFSLEEEPITSYEIDSIETDSALDPESPNNKLYGGARDLRGVSPNVTYKTSFGTRNHLVFSPNKLT